MEQQALSSTELRVIVAVIGVMHLRYGWLGVGHGQRPGAAHLYVVGQKRGHNAPLPEMGVKIVPEGQFEDHLRVLFVS